MKLAAILFLVCAVFPTMAQLQPAQHRAEHPQKHHEKASNSQEVAPYEQFPLPRFGIMQPQPTFDFVKDTAYPNAEYDPARDQPAKHDDDGIKWTDKVVAIFTGVLIAAAIVSGFISFYQWKALKESIAHAQTAAEAATASANSARRGADSLINLERPWMVATAEEAKLTTILEAIHIDEMGEIDVTVTFVNEGRTPAFIGVFHLETTISHDDIPTNIYHLVPFAKPDRGNPLKIDNENRVIGPGKEISFQIADMVGISRTSADRILEGNSAIWFFGRLEYTDFFKEDRTTHFCFIYSGREVVVPWGGMKENYMT